MADEQLRRQREISRQAQQMQQLGREAYREYQQEAELRQQEQIEEQESVYQKAVMSALMELSDVQLDVMKDMSIGTDMTILSRLQEGSAVDPAELESAYAEQKSKAKPAESALEVENRVGDLYKKTSGLSAGMNDPLAGSQDAFMNQLSLRRDRYKAFADACEEV